jgi:hypothetical protein
MAYPPQSGPNAPNAKDDLRKQAVELRQAGYSVPGIVRELGVARSTAFQWTKHIPLVQDTAEAERRKAQTGQLAFRVHIHETADPDAAVVWWAEKIGVDPAVFGRSALKRHNPKTNRLHQGAAYHGCLRVDVRKSADLCWRIASVMEAVAGEPEGDPERWTG